MTAEIPDEIVRYLAARDHDRAEQVNQAWTALTERERALVREAAVMAYVHGVMAVRGVMAAGGTSRDVQIPPDAAVVSQVIAACQAMPDMYPTLGEAR